jgi:hypothetical protein
MNIVLKRVIAAAIILCIFLIIGKFLLELSYTGCGWDFLNEGIGCRLSYLSSSFFLSPLYFILFLIEGSSTVGELSMFFVIGVAEIILAFYIALRIYEGPRIVKKKRK